MAEADPAAPAEQAAEMREDAQASAAPEKPKRKLGKLALMLSLPLILLIAATAYWMSLAGKVTTDNAYVKQDTVAVSAEVTGKLVGVYVRDGQQVKKGDLLFSIDPRPYEVALQKARAAIASAQANVTALSNAPALTGADISAAQEDIAFADAKLARQKALWKRGFTTKADLEAAEHASAQAREQLRLARAQQVEARAKLAHGPEVPGENPQIAAARAQLADAELNLSRTEVRAPANGRIAQSSRLQIGQQVVTNLPMLTLVETDSTYVEANFKETDLTDMKPGQRAKVTFDAYPDLVLKGHVISIGAGTGSEFSVLPAQNATGNWVKVTQRVPVRIAVDDKDAPRMIAGLSTEVTVYTGDSGAKTGN